MEHSHFGLEFLSTSVLLLDCEMRVVYANPSAESLFHLNRKNCMGHVISSVLGGTESLAATARAALAQQSGFLEHELVISSHFNPALHLSCTVTPVEFGSAVLMLEFHALNQQLKIAREERLMHEQELNRELLRGLAHEIRNPLGGIRGAAQLLEGELDRRDLREYTQVIVKEVDRLQHLLDRLLVPQRHLKLEPVNIHEVLERARSLVLAENPRGLLIERDYDLSLPELNGDREQLIQAVLNITRNAAQAVGGSGQIKLRTRVARQVTLAKKRFRLCVLVDIIDNGPGIPADLQDRIFFPLVSGKEGGTGLGLSLAQTYVNQHRGIIEFNSVPGRTCFSLLLPLTQLEAEPSNIRAYPHEFRLDH